MNCRDELKAREVIDLLRRSDPVLKNPEGLTEDIMAAIQQRSQRNQVFPLLLLQRLLAAASVAVLLLFGYEQYVVVEKVTTLETQFSVIKADPRYSDPLHMASAFDISKAGISISEIERLLSPEKGKATLSFSFIKKQLNLRTIK
jgi:hypothetical protein